MSDTQFYPLVVSRVNAETADTVTLFFDVPQDLSETFAYTQGQYLTLRFTIKGKEERRAYSMSSSPTEQALAVTVKRLPGGKVSNHINDNVKAGQTVEVMPPQGRFFTSLDAENRKTYYLFGAGSGITPLMSILKTVVEDEPKSTVHLLYGSRHDDGIIFQSELDALTRRFAGQLTVEHIVSQPKVEKGGWFKKGTTNWTGRTGRINAVAVDRFLDEHPTTHGDAVYFICGPGAMIDTVEAAITARGADSKAIHTERFVSAAEVAADKAAAPKSNASGQVMVTMRGERFALDVPAGKTILEAMLGAKRDAPYSCMAGACSTCMAKVTQGSVKMDVCYALDDDEVASGYILACQAHPDSDDLELTFDV